MIEKDFLRYKKELLTIILSKLPNAKIYLFGSRAKSKSYAGSDIDIAIDNKEEINFNLILDIYNKIEETTIPFMVDLVDINNISDSFRDKIMKEAIEWEM